MSLQKSKGVELEDKVVESQPYGVTRAFPINNEVVLSRLSTLVRISELSFNLDREDSCRHILSLLA